MLTLGAGTLAPLWPRPCAAAGISAPGGSASAGNGGGAVGGTIRSRTSSSCITDMDYALALSAYSRVVLSKWTWAHELQVSCLVSQSARAWLGPPAAGPLALR